MSQIAHRQRVRTADKGGFPKRPFAVISRSEWDNNGWLWAEER